MDKLVQELLDAASVVVGNLMKNYHDSRAVPDDLVGLCLAMMHVEDKLKNDKFVIDDGDYLISIEGIPIKLSINVKGNMVTYRDGGIGDVQDLRDWTFKRIEFRPPPDPESLTCFNCKNKDICKYVDDPYNTDGDCLASK